MKNRLFISIALILCLALMLVLVGCNKNNGDDTSTDSSTNTSTDTGANTDSSTDTGSGAVEEPDGYKLTVSEAGSYKIYALDYLGQAIDGAVIKVTYPDHQSVMDFADSNGSVTVALKAGDNYVTVESSATKKSFYLVKAEESGNEITFNAYAELDSSRISDGGTPDDGTPESIADDRIAYTTRSTGSYYATGLKNGNTVFFLFIPTQDGVYEFSASIDGVVGYYGAPINAIQQPIDPLADENGVVTLEIKRKNLGETADSTTPYLIGITASDASVDECLFTIHRAGDPEYTINDEPYTYLTNPKTPDELFLGYKNWGVTLNNIDISMAVNAVYNEDDGYYHLGSKDGDIIYVRITTDSPYLPAFSTVCETSLMSCYIYDGDTFIKKECYNLLISQYAEICDKTTGLYPLDSYMATAIKNHGGAAGWWNSSSMNYLFGETPINVDSAWLFACCTITVDETVGSSAENPIKVEKSIPTDIVTELAFVEAGATLYIEQTTKLDATLKVTDKDGCFKVIYNGQEYTATNGTITVNIVKADSLTFEIVNISENEAEVSFTIS